MERVYRLRILYFGQTTFGKYSFCFHDLYDCPCSIPNLSKLNTEFGSGSGLTKSVLYQKQEYHIPDYFFNVQHITALQHIFNSLVYFGTTYFCLTTTQNCRGQKWGHAKSMMETITAHYNAWYEVWTLGWFSLACQVDEKCRRHKSCPYSFVSWFFW